MKVQELLLKKEVIEKRIEEIKKAISVAFNKAAVVYGHHEYSGKCGVYNTGNQEFIFCIDQDVIGDALKAQLAKYEEELEPVNKKLEAIELMLNS